MLGYHERESIEYIPDELIRSFKERIGYHYKMKPSCLRVFINGVELIDDTTTLKKMGIIHPKTINVQYKVMSLIIISLDQMGNS